jgi:hypothetical protein
MHPQLPRLGSMKSEGTYHQQRGIYPAATAASDEQIIGSAMNEGGVDASTIRQAQDGTILRMSSGPSGLDGW